MHPLLAMLPLVALVFVMTARVGWARLPLSAHLALPGAAVMALALQALAGSVDTGAAALGARVIEGVLTALTPLAIVFGAILLFRALSASGAMEALTARLEGWSPDAVLRVVLIAWAFSYLVEGLSGFGTPAALAAPLLVGMGFPAIRAASACLVMNTVPVVFGAVGMPIWFGLGEIGLEEEAFGAIATEAAVLQCVAAPVMVALSLRVLFPWREVWSRAVPIGVVIAATVGASLITSFFSVEFPTIVGGAVGLGAAFAVGRVFGGDAGATEKDGRGSRGVSAWRAAFPLVATIALLAATRFEPLGLRAALNAETPEATLALGPLGELSISASLVVGVRDLLGTGVNWSMAVLYVPFVIPFIVVVVMSAPLLGLSARETLSIAGRSASSLRHAAVALVGALVFVKLMMHGGEGAPVVAIGRGLADGVSSVHGSLWLGVAPLVGALGSFFSGSATVSNLTFGPVQAEVADLLDLDRTRVLALQAVGAAMGNMVCVHNIVAVAAVLGLTGSRGGRGRDAGSDDEREPSEDPVGMMLRMNATPLVAFALVAGVTAGVMAMV